MKTKDLALLLGSLLLVAGVCYAAWLAFAAAVNWITSQESQIAAAIIAFTGTVVAGIGAVVISQQRAKAREIAEAHRPKKIEIYNTFLHEVVGVMKRSKDGESIDSEESKKRLEAFFFDFTTNVMLWGSPRVLRAYGAFRRGGAAGDVNVVLLIDDIIRAMRADLGLGNFALNRGDLIKMLITDPEKLDELSKPKA